MISELKGWAVRTFYKLVIEMNPILNADQRVNFQMVKKLLDSFNQVVNQRKTIDYDHLLEHISKSLKIPIVLIEPFLEIYVTGYYAMTGQKFVRMCSVCGKHHSIEEIQECRMHNSAVIKTAIGIVLIDEDENPYSIKN